MTGKITPIREVIEADPATVNRWLANDEAILIDVRETSEYEQEHIPGSVLVPLSVFEPDLFPRIPAKKVVFHCAIGKRSAAAGKQLLKAGHTQAINLSGGIKAWKEGGFATEVQFVPPAEIQELPRLSTLGDLFDARLTGGKADETNLPHPHPGVVLQEKFLAPLGLTQASLARAVHVSARRINEIIRGRRSISVDTAMRFARYFSTSEEFWLRLQMEFDLEAARRVSGRRIKREVHSRKAAA